MCLPCLLKAAWESKPVFYSFAAPLHRFVAFLMPPSLALRKFDDYPQVGFGVADIKKHCFALQIW